MTPETKDALNVAITAAGSQINLCRKVNLPQSSFWTWSKGRGPAPALVPELVSITEGQKTAEQFRRDVYGWLAPISAYLGMDMPDDARLAGIDLTWHQIEPTNAIQFLMASRDWSRYRARDAVDYLTDNGYLPAEIEA